LSGFAAFRAVSTVAAFETAVRAARVALAGLVAAFTVFTAFLPAGVAASLALGLTGRAEDAGAAVLRAADFRGVAMRSPRSS
jgi:hypothetical protein